ncbi:MAG: penicillin-binding protein A [Oscillospiraceae bacterium]|nr:penicillin-binding protein A [Oscillospiraceae bacterium]
MDNEKQFYRRSRILLGIFVVCLLFFAVLLYDAQVIDHEDYLSRSTTQVTTSQTVEASRGILVDRNGKMLVSNREIYIIDFDPALVQAADGMTHSEAVNRALMRLIVLCEQHGIQWTDTLPIELGDYGFTYTTATTSSTARTRFQNYLAKMKWSDSELTAESPIPQMTASLKSDLGHTSDTLSAPMLMELLREEFAVGSNFSDRQARQIIGVLYELELRKREITYSGYTFAKDISVDLISILTDGNFSGAVVSSETVRQYHTTAAAHILGRTGEFETKEERAELNAAYNTALEAGEDTSGLHYYYADDIVGKSGVEAAFESYLRGKNGTRLITTNAEGKITNELYSIEPQPGATVALTIDIDFQAKVEQALKEAVEAMNAEDLANGVEDVGKRGAAAVVVSVADSDILALASYPTYDPSRYYTDFNLYSADPAQPFFNRALGGAYAPGSTFKLCTSVAALESGIITPSTKIFTRGKYTYWNDYQPACWIFNQYGGSHGNINVSEAIYHSCNYFFYEVGRLMGIETLNEYAKGFGLGQPTGIELYERTGILDGPEYRAQIESIWEGGTVLQCAIGQGSSLFTPLQLANYVATLVRGGERFSAHLLDSVTLSDGSTAIDNNETELLSVVDMSPTTLVAVKKGMGDLVKTGSIAKYFQECIVSAGAKTGSAQVGTEVANGVFVCFAPFENPEIVVSIVIEQGGSGSALAATAVNILNAYFAPSDIGTALIPEGELLP